jgi:class 3 adenylate cyclase/HAMP domain-containing protein
MSFRLKTILLLVALSLAPYIVTMTYLGNIYRNDVEDQVLDDLGYQLGVTLDRINQQLVSQEKDLRFIATLDIMNDILTGDLDRRILNLILMKKADLGLAGEIEVVDENNTVVASTNSSHIGTKSRGIAFLSIPVLSTFDDSRIGELLLHFETENLTRYFENDQGLHYMLLRDGQAISARSGFLRPISVFSSLSQRPEFSVVLEQERGVALAILNQFNNSFIVALLIGVILISAVAFLVANYITRPILLLSSTARLITRTQDYTQRVQVQRGDEIGKLGEAFNKMIAGMHGMLERLKEENAVKLKLAEERKRAETLQTLSTKLSKYLSPQIYQSIFSGEKDVTLYSSRKKLTIFFSDIVNFTGTTDQMESEDLTQLLNTYLREMSDIALSFGATIDKYIGDAIMIFFGDPDTQGVTEDARRCVEMALAMRQRVQELQDEWRTAGFSRPFNIRVGIHTGYCTVGNFGTDNRMDYTIVGSAVNLASRIESNAEEGAICISEDTWLLVRDRFRCSPAAKLVPKGLNQAIHVYKVLDGNENTKELLIHDQGIQLRIQPELIGEEGREKLFELLKFLDDKPGEK